MQPKIRDAIISTWQSPEEKIEYGQIKKTLVNRRLIKETNDTSLTRWLKQLENDGVIKKLGKGHYALELHPKKYQVFDYLNELREKYGQYIWDGEVGTWISHICAATYINFDVTLLKKEDEYEAFSIISTRIGELFAALYYLRNAILERRGGLNELSLPDEVLREAFFGYLKMSINNTDTEELVAQKGKLLRDMWKRAFDQLYEKNKWSVANSVIENILIDQSFLEDILSDIEGYKRDLKKRSLFDVDKFNEKELMDRYLKLDKTIQGHIDSISDNEESNQIIGFKYSEKESETECTLRTAILIKVAETIQALNTNLEDFAVILTRHPSTMNRYYTPEHVLYDAMEWAKQPPNDETLNKLWQEAFKREGGFEGMVASQLADRKFTLQQYKELRTKPFVLRELSKYGSFDRILSLYNRKIQSHRNRRQKMDSTKAQEY
jgi:hypothetical protein